MHCEGEQRQERGHGEGQFGERVVGARSHMVLMVILVGYNLCKRAKLPRYFIELRKFFRARMGAAFKRLRNLVSANLPGNELTPLILQIVSP